MKRNLFLLVMCCCWLTGVKAQPQSSTADDPAWYLVQFVSGGGYLTTQGDGEILRTATVSGFDSQLFRFEKNSSGAYTITSKGGLTLYASATNTSGFVYGASSTTSSNTTFNIVSKSGGFEIQPTANSGVAFNQYQGVAIGNRIGLWTSGDTGNQLTFISEADAADIIEEGKETALMKEQMEQATAKGFHVIPFPLHVELGNKLTVDNDALLATIDEASTVLTGTVGSITFTTDETQPAEGYALSVTEAGAVTVKASTPRGFYYGLMTLKQMALTDAVFACEISDAPKLEHRGLMLDVSRHFFDVDEVKKVIDVMSLYKMNRFHWHLTDDQGWRIEIPEYPRLTEFGAIRSSSLVNSIGTDGLYDDTEYGRGCYYTLDQLRDVVDYASKRQVDIMPEIDLPGHMAAAVASYPELSCDPSRSYEVRVEAGISSDLLAVHKSNTMDFLKCVLGHMADVFPFRYMHIGGDECRVGSSSWQTLYNNNDADFKAFMNKYGLTQVTDVQAWLADTLSTYLHETYGKEIVVWNEVVSHWRDEYADPAGVMCYSAGEGWEKKSADMGMYSISTPTFPLYFDMMQGSTKLEDPYSGGYGNNSVPTVYNYSILGAYGDKPQYCLGAQGNLWTESTNKNIEVEHNLFPRGIALSENCWMPEGVKSWSNFRTRLQSHALVLDDMDVHYATQEIDLPAQTNADLAAEYLADPHPGQTGYPSQEAYDQLSQVVAEGGDASALAAALSNFRNTNNLTYPQGGKLYKIISAATKWDQRYLGSAMYVKNGTGLHIHYTPQDEPEELFYLQPTSETATNSFNIISALTGQKVKLSTTTVSLVDAESTGSTFNMRRPSSVTSGSTTVSYRPGIVMLRSSSYVLTTDNTGDIKGTNTNQTYCYPTTWYLQEIEDYSALTQGLLKKAQAWLDKEPQKDGSPSDEGRTYLQTNVVTPGQAAVAGGSVTAETYQSLLEAYRQFLAMPLYREAYPINFDKDTKVTHTRRLNTIQLGSESRSIPDNSVVYNFIEDDPFVVEAGSEYTAKLTFTGTWMNSYVYIDFGNDGEFNVGTPVKGAIPEGDDMVSYSFYSEDPTSDASGYNSAGTAISGNSRNTITLPKFTIPASTPTGDYRMRYKLDWNSIDPKGDIDNSDNNLFMNNGGAIADIVLHVDNANAIQAVEGSAQSASSAVYDLSGRRIAHSSAADLPKGIYVIGGRKTVVK